MPSVNRTRVAMVVGLIAATLATYGAAPGGGFIGDDHHVIERGRLIGSLANIPQLFLHDSMWNSYGEKFARRATIDTYRPLTMTTFFIERALFGVDPAPYHVTNVLIHALNVLLLFALGRRIGVSSAGSMVGALLFAVHPAIAEAVHWVNGRSDPLSIAFLLGALLVWLPWLQSLTPPEKHPLRLARPLVAAVLVLSATLCKETVFLLALPVGLLGLGRGLGLRRAVLAFAPWASGLALGLLLRVAALRGLASGDPGTLAHALPRVPILWFDALASLALPEVQLRPSLFEHYQHLDVKRLVLGVALVFMAIYLATRSWRRGERLCAWAFATFFLVLAPVALLTHAEGWSGWGRYIYPTAPLLCLLAGATFADQLLPRARGWSRHALVVAAGIVVIVCGGRTFAAAASWKDGFRFGQAQIASDPDSSAGYGFLAYWEYEAGRPARALELIDRALAIAPTIPTFLARRSVFLVALGRQDEASQAAAAALRLDADQTLARYAQALVLLNRGQQADAARALADLLGDEPTAKEVWATVRQAWQLFGDPSEFASTMRALASRPKYSDIAQRLLAR